MKEINRRGFLKLVAALPPAILLTSCNYAKSNIEALYPEISDRLPTQSGVLTSPGTLSVEIRNYTDHEISLPTNLQKLFAFYTNLGKTHTLLQYPQKSLKEDEYIIPEARIGRNLITIIPPDYPSPSGYGNKPEKEKVSIKKDFNDQLSTVRLSTPLKPEDKYDANFYLAHALAMSSIDTITESNKMFSYSDLQATSILARAYEFKYRGMDYEHFFQIMQEYNENYLSAGQPEFCYPILEKNIFDKVPAGPIINIKTTS